MTRLWRIRPRDASFIVAAYWYLLVAAWLLFIRRVPTQNWLSRWQPTGASVTGSPSAERTAELAARWTNTVARYPFPWARCLQRSIALCMIMERRGLNPVLQLGVRRDESGIDAHAWVEFMGEVLNDSPFVRTRFETFRSSTK